jgi:hypothetical protein
MPGFASLGEMQARGYMPIPAEVLKCTSTVCFSERDLGRLGYQYDPGSHRYVR